MKTFNRADNRKKERKEHWMMLEVRDGYGGFRDGFWDGYGAFFRRAEWQEKSSKKFKIN